jgi:hypothetical protein
MADGRAIQDDDANHNQNSRPQGRYIRTIRGRHDQIAGWQLHDEPSAIDQIAAGAVEFPLTITVEDAKGNVLKMRLQVEH